MPRSLRPFLLNSLLVLGSLLAAAALFELALRLIGFSYVAFYRPDEIVGLRLRANVEGRFNDEGSSFIRTNSAGFRDRERSEAKPPGHFRIAVLGDSYIEAKQVDFEETFPALLEKRLNLCGAFGRRPVEVLNFGVPGYGTAQELLTYRHLASRYAPDLVIVAVFTGNDIRNNSRELEPDKMRPFFTLEGDKLVEDRSFAQTDEYHRRTNRLRASLDYLRVLRIVQAAYFIKERLEASGAALPARTADAAAFEAGIDNDVYIEPRTREWQDAWAVTEHLFAQLDREVRASGASLLMVSLSTGIQVHPDPEVRRLFVSSLEGRDIFYPDRRVEAIASSLGVEFMMLAPELQARAEREKIFFHGFPNARIGTGHWNQSGHLAAAELVAAKLCRTAGVVSR